MATEAGQDEEPVAGTSFSQPKESVDTHLTMAEQMHQLQQMMGAIMNKFQKWEAEHDQTVAAESENESVGDSPARGGLNKALELKVNSARGEKSHCGEVDTDTDSEFCVAIPQTKESGLKVDMLTLLAADQERPAGPTVNEKLAEISRSRFRQKMPESKLKSKMDKYPVPENCPDVCPPTLNSELTDKGYIDRTTKKSDGRLVNVQTMLSAATSCLLMETNSLHEYATDLAGQISDGTAHAAATASEQALTRANHMLMSLADAIAILGMAQQEISLRRIFLIQSALPKNIVSICQNEDLPVTDKLFSGDVEKAIKSAREAHKHSNKSTPSTSSQCHHPYKRQPYGRPFLGQSGTPFKGYHSQRGRGAKQATFQRGFEKHRRQ